MIFHLADRRICETKSTSCDCSLLARKCHLLIARFFASNESHIFFSFILPHIISEEHPELKVFGDDDPIDVVEIGSKALEMGTVTEVKPLGVLAMIDDGELDWKVVAVAVDDPLAKEYNDIDDVPEAVKAGIREWFRWYKTPDDKPLNGFGFDEKYLDAAEAEKVIAETHESWKKLKAGDTDAGKLWLA